MKVLISDSISDRGIEILKTAGIEVDVKTKLSKDELKSVLGQYDGLIVRSATKVTADVLENPGRLKVIGRAGSGLDNVDGEAATKKGIVVMNTPGGNTVTTAEHSIGMLFAAARNIPQAHASLKAGQWEKKKYMGVELMGKTLGVVGLGNIGLVVANRALGLKMHVVAYDPFISEERAGQLGVELVDLPALYARSDFISVHTPLTKDTKHMIDARAFAQMKKGVRIINCARGGIVNEADLLDAMKSGKVAAAAFDVFEKEPPEGNPLLALESFIATPHLGASTEEAQENVATAVAEQIVDYLVHGIPRNAVNVPQVPAELLPKIRPYLLLAERMGSFLGQTVEGGIREVDIEYRGDVAEFGVAPITAAALKGLLSPILEEGVNEVSAPSIARERGIEVRESRVSEIEDYTSLIALTVKTSKTAGHVSGTLFGRKDPRIVSIESMRVEVVPDGSMLILTNNDKPGVIGSIGTFMGENSINIARMQLGREKAGGRAVAVVSIDSPVANDLLDRLAKLPNILSVKQVRL
ncbi:MAG: phosphoglycerate dehydrogenase [Nitrospirota bacterium]